MVAAQIVKDHAQNLPPPQRVLLEDAITADLDDMAEEAQHEQVLIAWRHKEFLRKFKKEHRIRE